MFTFGMITFVNMFINFSRYVAAWEADADQGNYWGRIVPQFTLGKIILYDSLQTVLSDYRLNTKGNGRAISLD